MTWKGEKKHCQWCDKDLTGRQQKWCSEDCSRAYGRNHWWINVRPAALERDDWTCIRCGFIGWSEVPEKLISISWKAEVFDRDVSELDWIRALGMVSDDDVRGRHPSWDRTSERHQRVWMARRELPQAVKELVEAEERFNGRHGDWPFRNYGVPGGYRKPSHQLEVNHIKPVRTRYRVSDCTNHLDNLETLCRPCHVQETRLQITTTRGYGPGQCTIACWEGNCDRCFQNLYEEIVYCMCPHHTGGDMSAMDPDVNRGQLTLG